MRRIFPWVLTLALLPLVANPTASSVWDSNEAFYTQTPREMMERGDWLVPYFNGQPRLNKPPLSYWLVACLYSVFGESLACERWLLALLGCASVLLAYGIGVQLRERRTALLAAAIFATNFRFLVLSRRLLIDVLMLTCILAGILFFLLWRQRRQDLWMVLTALAFGLGFLTKGPVAWLGLIVLLAYSYWEDRWQSLRLGPWKKAAAVLAVVSLSWYLALAWREGWQAVADFFWRENLGRFAHLDYGPRRGAFYYLGVILADFFPWSTLFFAAIVLKARRWLQGHTFDNDRLLLLWLGAWIGVFSFSLNKQEYYILPLYPAAAIWAADLLSASPRLGRWLGLAGGGTAFALACGLALLAGRLFTPSWVWWLPALAAFLHCVMVARKKWLAGALALSLLFASLFWFFLPPLEGYRPIRSLTLEIRRLTAHSPAAAGYYRIAAPSMRFYLNQPILELFDLEAATQQLDSGQPTFLIIDGGDWPYFQQRSRTALRVVKRGSRLVVTPATLFQVLRSRGTADLSPWLLPVLLITNTPPEAVN